ncbi:MAG: DUF6268 family outer membrane beta-barrel protein [Cyclobacteriaceae bacterium]
MKRIIVSIIVLISCQLGFAQNVRSSPAKEINSPNFLVHNQLTPELIKIEYAGGVSRGRFENESGEFIDEIGQNTFTFSGYPATLLSKEYTQIYMGFGYSKTEYTSLDNSSELNVVRNPLESFNVNAFVNTKIANQLYWSTYVQIGVQGDNPFDEIENSHNEVFLTKVNFKANRSFNVGLGAVYASNLGDHVVLPALAVAYSTDRYLVNIDFPLKAEVEGILKDGKFRPVVGVAFPASSYYVSDTNQNFISSGMGGYVGMRYQVLNFLYAYVGWQRGFEESFEVGSRGDIQEFGTLTNQARLVTSLNIQIAK